MTEKLVFVRHEPAPAREFGLPTAQAGDSSLYPHRADQLRKVRLVAGMARVVDGTEDAGGVDREGTGHHPRVAHGRTLHVAGERGAETGGDRLRTDQLKRRAVTQAICGVGALRRVADAGDARRPPAAERRALGRLTHRHGDRAHVRSAEL